MISPTNKKANIMLKYKDLFEGIGHQIVLRMMTPINKMSSEKGKTATYHPHSNTLYSASAGFKQITGLVAIAYVLLILGLFASMGLVYLIWPEEQALLTRILLTVVPFMLIFSALLLCFCLYLNGAPCLTQFSSFTQSSRMASRNVSPSGGGPVPDHLLDISSPQVAIQISHADFSTNPVVGGFGAKQLIQPQQWENSYDDMKDSTYSDKTFTGAKLDFLKYTD
jgi:hypothetical protein